MVVDYIYIYIFVKNEDNEANSRGSTHYPPPKTTQTQVEVDDLNVNLELGPITFTGNELIFHPSPFTGMEIACPTVGIHDFFENGPWTQVFVF